MKTQVIFSSSGGATKKLAEGIYKNLICTEKSIHDLKDGIPAIDGDIILLGYWIENDEPNETMKEFMSTLEGKTVGVFCTLAFFADSTPAYNCLMKGINLVKDKNTILSSFVCNGKMSEDLINKFRQEPKDSMYYARPSDEIRWDIMKVHPTKADVALASERFNERIAIFEKYQEENIKYNSLTKC